VQLTRSQKQELLGLYSNTNDSFFTFLNNTDYEKKMKKLKNAKSEYANYSNGEEVLFLLDGTIFGSADSGLVITDKNVFVNIPLGVQDAFLISEIFECSYVKKDTIDIDYNDIESAYISGSEHQIVNIINKLREFHNANIIKEKNLDLYLNITISQTLAISGGKYKDTASGYTIPIPKGVQNGAVLSWDGHGKSYGDVKGKLTVTVYIEQPKSTLKPEPKEEIKREPEKIIVDCVNCGKKHENPTSDECVFCGNSLTKLQQKKLNKQDATLKQQMQNDNEVDVEELELIVTCVNCSEDIKNYSSHICPHCREDANQKKKKVKKESEKTSTSSEFYLKIDNDTLVKDIKKQFHQETGLVFRVYESSRKQARGNKKLINLATKETDIRITTRMKIETIIEKFQEIGAKVRIASFDDDNFCNSNFTLANAKEKYSG